MRSIYLINTPYHFLVACGLALNYDKSIEKRLIIVCDFENAPQYKEIITQWDVNLFSEITLLNGRYGINKRSIIKIALSVKKNIYLFKKSLKNGVLSFPYNLFIFNDGNPEAQYLAFHNKKKGGVNTYVEDGMIAVYGNGVANALPLYQKIGAKLFFGSYYENIGVLGTYSAIQKVMVSYPNMIRGELKGKEIVKIPIEIFTILNESGFIKSFLEKYHLRDYLDEKESIKYLLLMPHSDGLNEIQIKKLQEIIILINDKLNYLYIKYHPRELRDNYLELNLDENNISLINKSIPIELIYITLIHNQPRLIIGVDSSSLISAKLFLDEARVVDLKKILLNKSSIKNKFNLIEPHSVAEFLEVLIRLSEDPY